MNIITIMSDEHSYQMMHFINRSILKTPNLDRLAAKSIVFDNAYTPCPVCAPARGSFITGKYVSHIGTWDNSTPYDGKTIGMSNWLNKHHVTYASIGKTHFHPDGQYGFAWEELPGYMKKPDLGCFFRDQRTARVGARKRFERIGIKVQPSHDDKVLEACLNWLSKNYHQTNWHLYIGFLDPHFPFYVKKENWDYYDARISQVPDCLKPPFSSLNQPLDWLRTYFQCEDLSEETARQLLIGYHCAITELDERIGTLMDKLAELNLLNNTIICYTSDHGEQMGHHGLWWKCTMFEPSAHIPLIVYVPNQPHRRISDPVNLTDWFPTVCDFFRLPTPNDLDGESLRPYLETGYNPHHKDFAFSEYHAHGMPYGMFMIRWHQYKYIFYCYQKPQLFDLSKDPLENHSLLEINDWTYGTDKAPSEAMIIAEECHKRLLSVCNPYESDKHARDFQKRMKQQLGISVYDTDMGDFPVLHPQL